MKRLAILLLATLGAAVTEAQEAPSLLIVEPVPGRYVSGRLKLRARVSPESATVVRVTFAADGQPVCARQAPPWECDWDAGDDVVSHSIRAVAVRFFPERGRRNDRAASANP